MSLNNQIALRAAPNRSAVDFTGLIRVMLFVVPFAVVFCLSATALVALGFEYVVPGGNPLQKVHPGTYLATMALGVFFVTGSSYRLRSLFLGSDKLIYYFAALFLMIVYAAAFLSVPFALFIDTWYLPGILFCLLTLLTLREKLLVARCVDVFMAINTALGMYEFGKDWRLVPLTQWSGVLGQWVYPHEWRSTSLLGHPLTNSYVLGTYMLAVLLGKRFKTATARALVLGFHCGGLIAFGSRGATVFLVIAIVLFIGYHLTIAARTGRLQKDILLYIGVGVPLLVLIIPAVLSSGVADKFLDRFITDKGSAESRTVALEIVASFPLSALVVGSPLELTNAILGRYNVVALENFWLSFLLNFGVVGYVIFMPALFYFCSLVAKYSSKTSWILIIYFFACCTTSVSLASKTLSFALIVVICMTTFDLREKVRQGIPTRLRRQPAMVQ